MLRISSAARFAGAIASFHCSAWIALRAAHTDLPFLHAGEYRAIARLQKRVELFVEVCRCHLERSLDRRGGSYIGAIELMQQRGKPLEAPALLDEQADQSGLHVRNLNLVRVARADEALVEIAYRQELVFAQCSDHVRRHDDAGRRARAPFSKTEMLR